MASRISYLVVVLTVAAALALGLYLYGGLGGTSLPPETPEKTLVRIVPGSFSSAQRDNFVPKLVRVVVGVNSTVVWVNEDTEWHDVRGSGFQSPRLEPGQRYSFTFTAPGEYRYTCTPHPWMSGVIIVDLPVATGYGTHPDGNPLPPMSE
jgi:hypothetical protein